MNDHCDIAVGFLAGGLARRMGGRNKALLEIGGRSILEWQLAATEQHRVRLINANGDARPYQPFGLPVIADNISGNLARLPAYWPVWIVWLYSINRYRCCCPVPPMLPLFRQI